MKLTHLTERILHHETQHTLEFACIGGPSGCSYAFPCDSDGHVFPLKPGGGDNLRACLDGTYNVTPLGVCTHSWDWTEDASGKCQCGETVILDGFTCSCDCGRDYDRAGNLLASREQWGEETGESLADILRIP